METTSEEFDFPMPSVVAGESGGATLEEALENRWIAAAVAGDDDAFRRLVEAHQDRVYHFCRNWLRDSEEAREATQDTFVRAYGALSRYENRGRFRSWLFRIALNLCRDRHRSRSGRQRRETTSFDDGCPEPVCSGRKPDEASADAEDLAKLRRGIDSLPESLRAVLLLRAIEGLDQETCAEILNCSTRAVEGRYYRARRALAEWWDDAEPAGS